MIRKNHKGWGWPKNGLMKNEKKETKKVSFEISPNDIFQLSSLRFQLSQHGLPH